LQFGHEDIGTEHILLGLIRDGDGVAVQVLANLGADLNRTRQQVIQLLQGYQGQEPASAGIGESSRPFADISQIESLVRQILLAAIERWVGIRLDLDDLDQEVARLRREKEAAVDRQDYAAAAALRNQEKQLLDARASREKEWIEAVTGRMPLARELSRVKAELERLRAILREHGIEPGDDAA
jgi:ATP-dependent Clp protease ATP-binding subunit ClpC